MKSHLHISLLVLAAALSGCGEKSDPAITDDKPNRHEHRPPHGGAPVVLGHEEYHLELNLDAAAGKLTAYVMDGELEKFVRIAAPSFTVEVTAPRPEPPLVFRAIANPATGESVGDTSQFEAQAGWLKAASNFDAVLTSLTVRAKIYTNVSFNFPKGNDTDEEPKK